MINKLILKENFVKILIINPINGDILDANSSACSFYGYKKEEIINKNIGDINILSHEEIFKFMEKAKGKQQHHFNFIHQLKNGEKKEVEVYSFPLDIYGETFLYSLIMDVSKKRKEENARKEAEKFKETFKKNFNEFKEGICIIDLNYNVIKINKYLLKNLDIDEKNILDQKCHQLFRNRNCFSKNCPLRNIRQGKNNIVDKIKENKNNNALDTVVVSNPFFDDYGDLKGMIQIYKDSGKLKEEEKKIKGYVKLLEGALEGLTDMVSILNPNRTILFMNKAGRETIGKDLKGVKGKKCYILRGYSEPCEDCNIEKVIETKQNQYSQRYNQSADIYFDCVHIPILNEYGEIKVIVERLMDITKIKRYEICLEESNYKQKAILNNLPFAAWLKDTNGNIVSVNSVFIDFFGNKEDFKEEIIHDEIRKIYKEVLTTKKEHYREYNIKQEKEEKWIKIHKIPVINDDNKVIGILSTLRDITYEKKQEKYLKEGKEEAEKANHFKSQFLANMSHEMRTPMNAIMGIVNLLKGTSLTKEQQEYVKMLGDSGERLYAIIQDVLDLSKIESGKMELEESVFEVEKIIIKAIENFRIREKEKDINITYFIEENVPTILKGDAYRLGQILLNLIGNAIKFTEKGYIRISLNLLQKEEERVKLKFLVEDTGKGIRKKDLPYLFKPFSQLDSSMHRKYEGTGLGLVICKNLVEMMGGDIGVNSTEGKGSTFFFTAKFEKIKKMKKEKSIEKEDLKGINILLAEDDPINQKITKYMLEKKNAMVTIVSSGKEVLTMLKEKSFDVILMDIHMPEMDGIQATLELRRAGIDTPIIAMTAAAMTQDKKLCLESGMQEYISKPVKSQELYKAVEKYYRK